MTIALAGVSLPIFFTGLLAKAIFVYGPSWLHLYTDINYVPFTDNPVKWAENLFLPWVTLAFLYAALYARLTRAGMLETMGEDYIRTARAKGLRERTVDLQTRPARRADPDRHHLRPRLRPAARRRGAHRDASSTCRASGSTPSSRHPEQRPAADPGVSPWWRRSSSCSRTWWSTSCTPWSTPG